MNKVIWPFLAFLSGAFLPIQAAFNSRLGKGLQSQVHASLVSFLVGSFALIGYVIVSGQRVNLSSLRSVPSYAWAGGILGAFYVTVIVFSFPKIGPALTFGLVVAGQMIISVLLDHFNLLGAAYYPINIWRIMGILMIIGGVIMIRKF